MATATGIRAGKAFVIIGAVDKTGQVLARVSRRMRAFGQNLTNIGRSIATGGLIAAVPIALSVKTFLTFDDAMRKVQARSGATVAEFASLREQAKRLGRETSFTAANVAELQGILARRGFIPKEIEDQVPNILNLAKSAGEGKDAMDDLRNAATLTAGTMAAFGLESNDARDIVDLFTQGVNNSALTLDGLLNSLKFVAPVAKAGGLSLQQTVQTLGELSNLWIQNTMGGTTFRRMVINLVKENKKLTKAGIRIEAEGGGFRPITDIIADITAASTDLSKVERLAVFEKIFGARAIAGAAGLANESEKSLKLAEALTDRFGAARKAAELMEAGIGGAFRRFFSAVQGVAIEIGEALAPGLIDIGKSISQNLNVFAEWIQANRGVIKTITLIITATIAAGAALILLGVSIQLIGVLISVLQGIIAIPFIIGKAAILAFKAAMLITFVTGKVLVLGWKLVTLLAFAEIAAAAIALKVSAIASFVAIKVGAIASFIAMKVSALASIVAIKVAAISAFIAARIASKALGLAIVADFLLGQFGVLAFKVVIVETFIAGKVAVLAFRSVSIAAFLALKTAVITSFIAIKTASIAAFLALKAAAITAFLVTKAAAIAAFLAIKATIIATFVAGRIAMIGFSVSMFVGYAVGVAAAVAWKVATLVSFAVIKAAVIGWKILTIGAFVASTAASILFGVASVASFISAKVAAIAFWIAANAPLAIFTIGLIAIIAVIAQVSGALGTLADGFIGIGKTVGDTFGGIMDAIAVGDMQAAWDILVLGLETTWLQFVDTLKSAWNKFTLFFVESFIAAKQVIIGVQEGLATALSSERQAVVAEFERTDEQLIEAFEFVTGKPPTKIERQALLRERDVGLVTGSREKAGQTEVERIFDQKRKDALKELGDFNAGIQESSDGRKKEISAKKEELRAKLDDIAARRAEQDQKEKAEELGQEVNDGMGTMRDRMRELVEGLDVTKPNAGIAPTISRGLEMGSVEAAKKFADNRAVSQQILIASQQLEEQKKGNKLLQNLGIEDEGGAV